MRYDSLCVEQSVQEICLLSPELHWLCYVTYACNVSCYEVDYPYRPLGFSTVKHFGIGLHYVTPQETVSYLQHVCQAQANPLNPTCNT